jgi:uncharacterized protein
MLRRRMLTFAMVLGLTYLGLGALLFLLQRALLFPAPREAAPLVGRGKILQVPGGTPMLWRPVEGTGPVVVHFHGNAEQIASEAWLGEELARRGVSFAAVEYPGYPGATGGPSEEGIVAAAEKALQHLTTTMGVSPERVVLSGQSLGTGAAVVLASRGWGTRTVLLSPYTSLPAVAGSGILRLFPTRLLMRDRFDSEALAPGIHHPVLVLHGDRDEIVPFELGKALAGRFPQARFVRIEGAGHNDLWDHAPTAAEYHAFVAQ